MLQKLRRRPLLVLIRPPAIHLIRWRRSRRKPINAIGYFVDVNWKGALQRRLGISSESVTDGFGIFGLRVVETLRVQGMARAAL
jgi:hypothetical protein